jgi:ABC-2 type transport system permease protein
MISFLKSAARMYKIMFPLELKSLMAYPETFWFAFTTIPLWSLLQILFIETIYGQVDSFLGYTRMENYILFGTFKIVQSLAVILFMVQLDDFTDRVRGQDFWSFDMMLLKPIDSQIFTTMGRIWFGSISALSVGVGMVVYGFAHEPHMLSAINWLVYILCIFLSAVFFYILYFFIQTWLFWFEYLQVGETLWFTVQSIGEYPRRLYQGGLGLFFNIAIPITLAAAVPTELLLGKMPWYQLGGYVLIVGILFYLTRLFWKYSIKKYSSFSS